MNAEEIGWDALRGALVTRALGIAADLRLAEALAAGPRSHEELARERGVDADADALYRVLRALASDGIFEETEPGVFRNTAPSELLAGDGWADFAHLFGGAWFQAVAGLDATGEPSFPRVHGSEFWAWLAAHPSERAGFDRAMAQGWRTRLDRLESVDWRGDELVVDVGGGNGALLVALLKRHPRMRGIVFDLPETVRDEQALGERLVVLDSVIEPGNGPDGAKWLDLLILSLVRGRERTAEQWQALLGDAGWRATRVADGAIEAEPA